MKHNSAIEWPISREEMQALVDQDMNDCEIADRCGVFRKTVWRVRTRYGICSAKAKRLQDSPEVTANRIAELAGKGLRDREIGAYFGRGQEWARLQRIKFGIKAAHRRGGQPGNDGGRACRKKTKGVGPSPAMKAAMKRGWATIGRKKASSFIPDSLIDAMIAAYKGPVTICEPMSAEGALYLQRPYVAGLSGKKAAA